MKKTLKWLFFAPAILFGIWLIALYSEEFREHFINTTHKILKNMANEIERSL